MSDPFFQADRRARVFRVAGPALSLGLGWLLVAWIMVLASVDATHADSHVEASSHREAHEALIDEAKGFLAAFAAKDMERVGDAFAPGARVQRARFQDDGPPEVASFEVDAWLEEAGASIADVADFEIESLESAVLDFGPGATVSVRFRATGDVGVGTFVNDGVDTFSFAEIDGAWKIVLYNSAEKLVFRPADDG